MILITGGAGYIGGHCALELLNAGHDIVIFDSLELGHMETIDALRNVSAPGRVVDFIRGNLQNAADINAAFNKYKFDAVIHFAAYSQVGESMRDPQKYYFNNVYGTLNLLRAMLDHDVKKIVFSSTAATYGEPEYVPIDESHPQNPINPYGNTKLMIERILDDYDRAYGMRSVRLRYFNVAGADDDARIGEWHDPETHLIPNILKATFSGGKTFEMYGTDYDTPDGTCVRDYINVCDLARAHALALKYLDAGGATNFFNLGTNDGATVRMVFSACEGVTGKQIPVIERPRRDGDPAKLVADNRRACDVLGWRPTRSLTDSVRSAYQWECALQKRLS